MGGECTVSMLWGLEEIADQIEFSIITDLAISSSISSIPG